MNNTLPFRDVLDAADNLSLDEQQELIDIVRRRIAERRRWELVRDVQQAQDEFAKGQCRPANVDQLMSEIES